ncbi:MAG: hypothetical protein GY830_03910 [Bacteroidetes bacterium]|nr:hypothetical protein [Bacteroidota bacterium]
MVENNIEGQILLNVELVFDSETEANFLDQIKLYFKKTILIIKVDIDTGEMELDFTENDHDDHVLEYDKGCILNKYINKKLVFIWKCANSEEYFDVLVLAFEDCLPNILIHSASSSLDIFELNKINN